MNKITQSAAELLAQYEDENNPVLSMYLPTHRFPTPPHMQEDQTRFKNLLHEAREKWLAVTDDKRVNQIIQHLEARLEDVDFWRQATEGMAIFANYNDVEVYHLPVECESQVCVSSTYDITPLLVLLARNQPYNLLVLAMHNAKLLKGDMYGLEPVAVEFPASPEDALNIDEMFSSSNTVRSQNGPSGAGNAISPHGQGDSNQAGREERLQYFRIIDSLLLSSPLVDQALPLLVAGTDAEAGDYKSLSKYPHLLDKFLSGNHSAASLPDLHQLAWPMVRDQTIETRNTSSVDRFHTMRGAEKSSLDMKSMLEAAKNGRIDCLLVGMIEMTTDTVSDTIHRAVPLIRFTENYVQSQVAQLARLVFKQGGTIYGMERAMVPERATVAAIYRYKA